VARAPMRPRLPGGDGKCSAGGNAAGVKFLSRRQAPGASPSHQVRREKSEMQRAAQAEAAGDRTVVLDVEQGGIEVPSFIGKTVRGAVEAAQDAGLELEAVGSGVARQQSPPAGRTWPPERM
jgi:hypothetical protein